MIKIKARNVSNSWAIACDPRLESGDFDSQTRSPRINQRFLRYWWRGAELFGAFAISFLAKSITVNTEVGHKVLMLRSSPADP